MPTFRRHVIVSDLNNTRFFEADATIDTGSTHSQIPEEAAEYLGLVPQGSRFFRLADGEEVERPWANALLALANLGEQIASIVIIGRPGSAVLFGVSALDGFGLGVDTNGERLIPKVLDLLAQTRWPTI